MYLLPGDQQADLAVRQSKGYLACLSFVGISPQLEMICDLIFYIYTLCQWFPSWGAHPLGGAQWNYKGVYYHPPPPHTQARTNT